MRHCYVLRVFTRDEAGGNHLGVIPDVTGLTRDGMQSIAADLGFSETVFLDWRDGGTPKARIFTPASELPFAGHPLVGAAWVLTQQGPGGPSAIECGVGDVIIEDDDDVMWIKPPFDQEVRSASRDVSDWVKPLHVSTSMMPLPYLVAELDSVADVASLNPPPWGDSICVWAWDEPGQRLRARFFAEDHGVVEDPATGSAAVALAASLRARGMPRGAVTIHQGEEIGHPSLIQLEWDHDEVRVGGLVTQDDVRILDV